MKKWESTWSGKKKTKLQYRFYSLQSNTWHPYRHNNFLLMAINYLLYCGRQLYSPPVVWAWLLSLCLLWHWTAKLWPQVHYDTNILHQYCSAVLTKRGCTVKTKISYYFPRLISHLKNQYGLWASWTTASCKNNWDVVHSWQLKHVVLWGKGPTA